MIKYITIVGKELKNKISHNEFKKIVNDVLNDTNGWNAHNIYFTYYNDIIEPITTTIAKKLPIDILKIYIHDDNTTDKICEMRGLSCTRFNKNGNPIDIIINYKNWMGGSKSKLPIQQYRKYVINHEVGHWLGLEHSKCPLDECRKRGIKDSDCPASIMQQMSKGLAYIAPCKESCTPLPPDWGVDNIKSKSNSDSNSDSNFDSNSDSKSKCQFIIFIIYIIILILLIIILFYYLKFKINYGVR